MLGKAHAKFSGLLQAKTHAVLAIHSDAASIKPDLRKLRQLGVQMDRDSLPSLDMNPFEAKERLPWNAISTRPRRRQKSQHHIVRVHRAGIAHVDCVAGRGQRHGLRRIQRGEGSIGRCSAGEQLRDGGEGDVGDHLRDDAVPDPSHN
jgi:hypothetical protein